MSMQLLTHSRQDCFKTCRKKHWFAYEERIRPETDAKALRQGSAFHDAVEQVAKGKSFEDGCEAIHKRYESRPEHFDKQEWDYECETVLRIFAGYCWRWADSGIEYIAAEQSYELPLINPATGKPTPLFKRAGKVDGIIKLSDGRLAVIEHKLLGDDIGPESDLWRLMRMSHQVSGYVTACRDLGYEIDTVLYDVARKPTIKPTKVPILDDLGAKIVLNESGTRVVNANKEWRQTGDKDKGYTLQERAMTPDEWGEKLNDDIAKRPDFYFQRVEVPRLDDDLEEYKQELWDIQLTIRDAQKNDRHYRTVNKNSCGFCSYFNLCSNRGFDHRKELPEGFVRVDDVHPELERKESNGHDSTACATTAQGSAATAS